MLPERWPGPMTALRDLVMAASPHRGLKRRINSLDAPARIHSGNEKALPWLNLQPRYLARHLHWHEYPPALAQSQDDLGLAPAGSQGQGGGGCQGNLHRDVEREPHRADIMNAGQSSYSSAPLTPVIRMPMPPGG